jgi:hypothetical protein
MAKPLWKSWREVVTLRDDVKTGDRSLQLFAADSSKKPKDGFPNPSGKQKAPGSQAEWLQKRPKLLLTLKTSGKCGRLDASNVTGEVARHLQRRQSRHLHLHGQD